MKAPTTVELVWERELILAGHSGEERELILAGHSGETSMVLDSAGQAGPSPVQALAFALAGCMAMDVVHILRKGRFDLRGLRVVLTAERAQENPHRVTAVTLEFALSGAVPKDQVQRAIDLSHEKYCSVWHSMRQDIPIETRFTISA